MAEKAFATNPDFNHKNRKAVWWENLTDADTGQEVQLEGGKYCVVAIGTFNKTVELQYSPDDGTTWVSIDSTNLNFSAAGMYNMEVPRGKFKPVLAGAGVTDVDLYVTPLPSDAA